MALVVADRVLETATSPGTGPVTLQGAALSFQSFSAAIGNGNSTFYCIVDQAGPDWEVGIGTYSSTGNTLSRTTVLSSSNAGSLVNFSTGIQNVFVTYPSEKSIFIDASGNTYVPNLGATTPSTGAFTTLTASTSVLSPIVGAGTGSNLSLQANATTLATLDANGNLGLGVTPSAWNAQLRAFDLGSNCAIYSSSGGDIGFQNNSYYGVDGNQHYKTTGYANLYQQYVGTHRWYIAPSGTAGSPITFTQAMTLDNSGRLLLGTTSVLGGNALANFAESNGSGIVLYVSNTANSGSDQVCRSLLGSNCNNTTSYHFVATTGSVDHFYIYGNGNVVNTNNSYGALSDIKLKENIVDTTPKLADLCKVKIKNYNFINDPNKTKQLGVIAQELEEVFPSLVETTVDKDSDGKDIGTVTKQVKYSVFVPIMIKAIQEQQEMINQLKAEIAELKGAK
jgi:hypothetical protein